MAKLEDIESIGPKCAEKLRAAGIGSQESLLKNCGKPAGRKKVCDDTGFSSKQVLNWANRADLARVKGVGEEYADLLECSGVDTVPELAQRNAANLHAKMQEVNDAKNLVRKLPALSQVEGWVAQAKELPRALEY